MKRRNLLVVVIVAVGLLVGLGYAFRDQLWPLAFQPTSSPLPTGVDQSDEVEVLAANLETPWAIAQMPNGDLLVTERPGQIRRIGENGGVHIIEGVEETSEGGLLGLAIHPEFEQNRFIYIYLTSRSDQGLVNQVRRYTFENDQLHNRTIVLDNIPASQNHDGGVLAFGPDEKLYITTGDAGNADLAQDTDSLAGKILRINDDGSIPEDNPFNNEVWSYGHRNPQGLAWDGAEQLWSTEHGPSGLNSGRDELNLIAKGGNYGWPEITGNEFKEGMRRPMAQSGDDDTWAPAGLVYANGSLYFTGLRGQTLYQATIGFEAEVDITRHLSQQYGRMRAIFADEDGLIVGTSNRDGRGNPAPDDDRLIRLPFEALK